MLADGPVDRPGDWVESVTYTIPWVDSYTAEYGRLGWLVGLCDGRSVMSDEERMKANYGKGPGDLVDIRVKDIFYARFLDSKDGQGLPLMPDKMTIAGRDKLIQHAIVVLLRHAAPATRP